MRFACVFVSPHMRLPLDRLLFLLSFVLVNAPFILSFSGIVLSLVISSWFCLLRLLLPYSFSASSSFFIVKVSP